MGATGQNAARSVVQATSVPIHDIGTSAYLSPDIAAWAAEWGWSNPFAFYFAGRGGMLGDVSPEVVTSAFGWFEPSAVHAMYSEGIGVAGATGATGAAARMAEAHGNWGEKHYGTVEGLEEIVAVAEELVERSVGELGLLQADDVRPALVQPREQARLPQPERALRRCRLRWQTARNRRSAVHYPAFPAPGRL